MIKTISKKIWNKIITSGLRGIVAGICFVIALSASAYFASAHFSKAVLMENESKPTQEAVDNQQNDAQVNTEQNNGSSEVAPEATEVKAESQKTNSTLPSSHSCNDELKAQALKVEESTYNAAVASENAREQKALDDLKVARDQKIAQLKIDIKPDIDALSAEISSLYAQKNAELARLPHDSQGRIINSTDQINQINAKYDPQINECRLKQSALMLQPTQEIYKQDQITVTEIVKESKMKLAELDSAHQAKADQINNACY
jgi:hypothetical protein